MVYAWKSGRSADRVARSDLSKGAYARSTNGNFVTFDLTKGLELRKNHVDVITYYIF